MPMQSKGGEREQKTETGSDARRRRRKEEDENPRECRTLKRGVCSIKTCSPARKLQCSATVPSGIVMT